MGLTTVPTAPLLDPLASVMSPAEVAEDKRYCSSCNAAVGRSRDGQPGRTQGFCSACGSRFDFDPKLNPGDVLGGQYEVVGCLAHGGMGWIYLARDRNVNDRWVVLKGLLNASDPDALAAAVAEKRFLAEVEHPLIVEIYNFVNHIDATSYIVMEYVGGRSLSQILKARLAANGGSFDPIPVDQAIAYILEVLPAFSYLHALGLIYCDFKPANLIQVGDAVKLIDLGGVRRLDDDTSAIYGTVGFQAPEVASEGPTVASDIFTIARTLAVMLFEFQGYQSTYVSTLPSPEQVPLFERYDSLYRLLLKATAPAAHDRFQSADEMREQLLGVLREVVASATGDVTRSLPSTVFDHPPATSMQVAWSDLPTPKVDPDDPLAGWLATVTVRDPAARVAALASAPETTPAVRLAIAEAALAAGDPARAAAETAAVLDTDPWNWRAMWIDGLAALARGDAAAAVAAFNAVYGELPGELAPKVALALACEGTGDHALAWRLYETCARTDAAFVSWGRFGQARISRAAGDVDAALAALAGVPSSSRAWNEAHLVRADLLVERATLSRSLDDLAVAADEAALVSVGPYQDAVRRASILSSALDAVLASADAPGRTVGGVEATQLRLRLGIEAAWRDAARYAERRRDRIECVDRANDIRPLTTL
jgi:serine/threonine-protein kinase PknG